MQSRELQERQEQTLFDNRLTQEFLNAGDVKGLKAILEMNEMRLVSGMTAEEIDAVSKRAQAAFEKLKTK